MAAAASDVTLGPSSRVIEYPPTSARKAVAVTLVAGGSDGAAVGDYPASIFGLRFIEHATPAVNDGNDLIVVIAPSYDGTSLLGKAAATAAAADIPADTYRFVLFGY